MAALARALICCYNAARNAGYTPLSRVSDAAIKETGTRLREKGYYEPKR